MKKLILVFLLACSPAVSRTATEEVFFAHGMLSANIEAAQMTAAYLTSGLPRLSFRIMAAINRILAHSFAAAQHTIMATYLEGRASAFDQLADLEGEG